MRQRRRRKRALNREMLAVFFICLGYFVTILDVTAVNVTLPRIHQDLGGNTSSLQWVIDGYALVLASLLLTGGLLGDRYGARKIFLTGLSVFVLASLACGLASTMLALQVARLFQGVGASALVPTSLALIRGSTSGRQAQARAFGIYGAVGGIAAAAGPVLAGILTTYISWRCIFYLNLPIGLFAYAGITFCVNEAEANSSRTFDIIGQLLGGVFLFLLTNAAISYGSDSVSMQNILLQVVLGLLFLAFFIFWERNTKYPMIPISMFRSSVFSVGVAVGFLINSAFFGQLFIINLFFQQFWGLSAVMSGCLLLPELGVVALASYWAGRVSSRAGESLPLLIGTCSGVIGLAGLALMIYFETSYFALIPFFLLSGFGMAFAMPPMTSLVMSAISKPFAGVAGGILNSARQVGTVLGIAVLGSVVAGSSRFSSGVAAAMGCASAFFLIAVIASIFIASSFHRSGGL